MIPWQLIDRAEIPKRSARQGQGTEISADSQMSLYRRGEEYSIRVDSWELMNSRRVSSEQEIATAACQRLGLGGAPSSTTGGSERPPCVLIGGLGMGYTLRAALDHVPQASRVIIAELVPDVVRWNREHLGHLAGEPLADARVEVYLGDVADRIRQSPESHDAIVLDVDNGPQAKPSNSEGWLYSQEGLDAIRSSLRPRGVLSIWSAGPSTGFAKRIEGRGFAVEEIRCRSRGKKGKRHVSWLAERNE